MVEALGTREISAREVLGIPLNKTLRVESILQYHRDAVKRSHPDVGGEAGDFQRVRQAFKELLRLYDRPNAIVVQREWPGERAEAVIRGMVKRKIGMFEAFPEYSIEDLSQIALIAAMAAWPRYSQESGHWSTFIYTVGWRRVCDEYRKRQGQGVSEARAAIREDAPAKAGDFRSALGGVIDAWAKDRAAALDPKWLAKLYRAADKAFPTPIRPARGRPMLWPLACYVVAVAVMRRRRLSGRGMVEYLQQRPEIARAIGFHRRIPLPMFFYRAIYVAHNLGLRTWDE